MAIPDLTDIHPAEGPSTPSASPHYRLSWSIARLLFRTALGFPGGVLRAAMGRQAAHPVGPDGAEIDPRARFHAWMVNRFKRPSSPDPVSARRPSLLSLYLLEGDPVAMRECRDLVFPGPGGPLRARLYVPRGCPDPSPALVYLHFGGCVIGDLSSCHTACTILAEAARCRVLSVDYRLAPEHKFPAAVHDAAAAYRWLRGRAGDLAIQEDRIGIGGDSAGGYLAAAAVLLLMRTAEALPALQLLIYPVLEMDRSRMPPTAFDDCYPLTRPDMEWYAAHYLRTAEDAADPLCSIDRAPSLRGMPATILVQAGHDLLFGEGARLAGRLAAEDVPLTRLVYPTLPHAFTAMSGGVPAARAALVEIAETVGRALRDDVAARPSTEDTEPGTFR